LRPATPIAAGSPATPASVQTSRIRAVAALGRLDPRGEIRSLAAPISGIGGSPRLTKLLVQEGSQVQEGDLLAEFDTAPGLRADQRRLTVRINNLRSRLTLQQREIKRYRRLGRTGAIASVDLDDRESELLSLEGELQEAIGALERTNADLVLTELRAPINGTVLRLHTRVGERPGDEGVLELGANHRMEALIEVYESDIDRVTLGQQVSLISENGGFNGSLKGKVIHISPQVRQREVLATDPTQDADARIVEVRVDLDPDDARRVRNLTGLKVIARLEA
jgi:HlyD family secretion protein